MTIFDINILAILVVILLVIIIIFIGSVLPKRLGNTFEIVAVIGVVFLLFYTFPFSEAVIIYTAGSIAYGVVSMIYSRQKNEQFIKLKAKLTSMDAQLIEQEKNIMRLLVDFGLTIIVSCGAIVFYIFAPDTYALLRLIIIYGLITVGLHMIVRIVNFITTKLYYIEDEGRFVILSTFQSRDFPLSDLKEVNHQSAPDLLRLHPLFTFLSENRDMTFSFNEVLRLSFPGEHIYIAPKEVNKWQKILWPFVYEREDEMTDKPEEVLPLWHPKNLRRLFWKGYFSVTVKGVSAYTGLLILFIFLKVPSYIIVVFIFLWWLFNLYVSDRVLIAGTDAVEIKAGELFERAKKIFKRAGIEQTKLYLVDSPIHNGLATGMNIGRGIIMITKATTELTEEAVDAILAHEAIHVKKRDVLLNQLARMMFFGLITLLVFLFEDQIYLLAENLFLFIPIFYLLMILFPLYLSFVAQWAEVRADYLGAQLLIGGSDQMGSGLRELGYAIDEAQKKSGTYQMNDEKPLNDARSDERPIWFFRMLEFQVMPHPPLYFRIENVLMNESWTKTRWNWIKMRCKESIPFLKHE